MAKFNIASITDAVANVAALDAENALGEVQCSAMLADILRPLSGKVGDVEAVEAWEAIRKAFVSEQVALDVVEKTSQQRWARLVKAAGLTKPMTAKAAAARKAREKSGPVQKTTGVTATATVASADKAVSENARLTACLELLKGFDPDQMVRAQAALLAIVDGMDDVGDDEAPF